jgi:hypothetical protein
MVLDPPQALAAVSEIIQNFFKTPREPFVTLQSRKSRSTRGVPPIPLSFQFQPADRH